LEQPDIPQFIFRHYEQSVESDDHDCEQSGVDYMKFW